MDDGTLRERLWQGFARLQTLLGGDAAGGVVAEEAGIVASFVPGAPDSPTLNASIVIGRELDLDRLEQMRERWERLGVRRWGVWVDGANWPVTDTLRLARLRVTSSSPGMAAEIADLSINGRAPARETDLATVGHVNDLAYGNPDARLERTLSPLPPGLLHAYVAELGGRPASVALALHHQDDCGISFVATAPHARRQGLASDVMQQVASDAREAGLTSATLQATSLGEKLYVALGYRKVSDMQLWERRR
jgi:ribosomal protein S18 acetylase RimI-like enzyme